MIKNNKRVRGLCQQFLKDLNHGHLRVLVERVRADKDLDLQIRDDYINIYFKGNSLLKLYETGNIFIDEQFTKGLVVPTVLNGQNIKKFIKRIPLVKENIIRNFSNSNKETLEAEYEQLIIRANNLEQKSTSEFFVIDRQYQTTAEEEGNRFDLTGFYWPSHGRRRDQIVPLSFVEVKFALNNDINEVHHQIDRYYKYVKTNLSDLVNEYQSIFKQKLELGLINQDQERLNVLETLKFSDKIEEYQFIIALVDYNPNSHLLNMNELKKLPFSNQVKIFYCGFAIWEQYLEKL